MSEERRETKAPQTQVVGLKMVFSSIFMGGSLLFDFYAMINYPKLLWLIGLISFVFIASVYVFSNAVMQLRYANEAQREDHFNDLLKSSKASYLLMRKYFDEIQDQLDGIEEKSGIPQEEIINAQKSIAKISISRNKENTDALMNSNDKLLEKIFDFEDQIKSMEEKILSNQKAASEEGLQDVLLKQKELANTMKEVELSLRKDLIALQTKVSNQQQQVMMASAPAMMPSMTYTAAVEENTKEFNEIPNDVLDDMVEKAGAKLEEEIGTFEPEEGEVISFDAGTTVNEPTLEPEVEMEVEPEVAPMVEEKPPMPDLSDPNHKMTPEEIAALLENTTEPKAAPEPEPVVEEKPPMPDLSDPNHKMTPEEIAAMLANM